MSLRFPLFATFVTGLLCWERKRALRCVAESKLGRDARNLVVAVLAGAVVQLIEAPVALAVLTHAQRNRSGLLPATKLPDAAKTILAIVLLDYTLYLWHRMTHQIPLLWRFHQVHHLDREMDASTALRFHFGEIAFSVAFRAVQIRVLGPSPRAYAAWQTFLFFCILFHHSNTRLPLALERRLAHIVVTPRLHGIHHSIAADEVNSNWSSGLTAWDWLHGTLRTDVPQGRITIGVRGLSDDRSQQLNTLLALPFGEAVDVIAMPTHSRQPLALLKT